MFPGLSQEQQRSQRAQTVLRDVWWEVSRGAGHVESHAEVSPKLDVPGVEAKGRKDKLEERGSSGSHPVLPLGPGIQHPGLPVLWRSGS